MISPAVSSSFKERLTVMGLRDRTVAMAVTGKQTNRIPFSSSCPLDSIASSIRQYMTFAVLLTGNPVNALGKGIQGGKTKKACKLKLLPDEAEIIYKIFDLYEQYDSLTMTETELLRQGVKTKTGRSFTRFSIKSILQNPVYLIADKDAYPYFVDNEAELFSPESDFDGIPAQSQEKGQVILHKL